MKIFNIIKRIKAHNIAVQEKRDSERADRLSNQNTITALALAGNDGLLLRFKGETYFGCYHKKHRMIGIVKRFSGSRSHFDSVMRFLYVSDLTKDNDGFHISEYHPFGMEHSKYPVKVDLLEDLNEMETISRLYHRVTLIDAENSICNVGVAFTNSNIRLRDYIDNCIELGKKEGHGEIIIAREKNGERVYVPYHAILDFTYMIKEPENV